MYHVIPRSCIFYDYVYIFCSHFALCQRIYMYTIIKYTVDKLFASNAWGVDFLSFGESLRWGGGVYTVKYRIDRMSK